ncbi:hypothetical protein ACIQUG_05670 [Ensifer sp. NPDC090286]|uniref:hypothetical protein n=1 Tax=Ensifer sp. NPDC090286 TaxID=3363991 RepID=UPI003839FBF9
MAKITRVYFPGKRTIWKRRNEEAPVACLQQRSFAPFLGRALTIPGCAMRYCSPQLAAVEEREIMVSAMQHAKKSSVFTIATLLAAAAGSAPAQAYSLYRTMQTDRSGSLRWIAANFGVSGPSPGLHLFHYANDAAARAAMPNAPCLLKIDLPEIASPKPGSAAPVGESRISVDAGRMDQPHPFPWSAEFDNNPAGHWAIPRSQISAVPTNNAASRVAAAGFRSLATTPGSGVTVVNGNLANCAVD